VIKPIFKSTYSIGKSILTIDEIIQICKDKDLKGLTLVEDNLTSFMKVFHACSKNDIDLTYGLRITMCNSMESKDSDHKCVIFALDDHGCKLMNKIYSKAFVDNDGRITYEELKSLWDKDSLSFVVPFYDSFIHQNNLFLKNCIPEMKDLNPRFWIEKNNLPYDKLIEQKVIEFTNGNYPVSFVKSIYYKNKEDVEALQTYKILCNRTFGRQATLSCPNLNHFSSDEFCFESYLENTK
jgi:DNA polymerase III alpha subunit